MSAAGGSVVFDPRYKPRRCAPIASFEESLSDDEDDDDDATLHSNKNTTRRWRVDLKILRGRGLAAKDDNVLTEGSSDAYCVVDLDGTELGRTPPVTSLSPVWPPPQNTFAAVPFDATTVLRVRVLDEDLLTEDDPMGEVAVRPYDEWRRRQRAASSATRDAATAIAATNPNRWYPVQPTDGCDCSGALQLQLLFDDASGAHKDRDDDNKDDASRERLSSFPRGRLLAASSGGPDRHEETTTTTKTRPYPHREKPKSMRRLSASEPPTTTPAGGYASLLSKVNLSDIFVWGAFAQQSAEASIFERVRRATTPVFLHIYDVGHSAWIANINRATEAVLGGVFHGAVEVHGREFSFGGCRGGPRRATGVFGCQPRKCPLHTYRESVYLGDCGLDRDAVHAILLALRDEWQGCDYHVLRHNCCSFAREFAVELGLGGIPSWVDRLATVGSALDDMLRLSSQGSASQTDVVFGSGGADDEADLSPPDSAAVGARCDP